METRNHGGSGWLTGRKTSDDEAGGSLGWALPLRAKSEGLVTSIRSKRELWEAPEPGDVGSRTEWTGLEGGLQGAPDSQARVLSLGPCCRMMTLDDDGGEAGVAGPANQIPRLCGQMHSRPCPLGAPFRLSVEGLETVAILFCTLSTQELTPLLPGCPLLSLLPLLFSLSLTILGIDSRAIGQDPWIATLQSIDGFREPLNVSVKLCVMCVYLAFIRRVL